MINNFFQELNKIIPISNPEILSSMKSILRFQKRPAGSILLNEGDISQNVFFIIKGMARAYYYEDEVEVTSWIIGDGEFIYSTASYVRQKPSFECIQLIENSEYFSIVKEDLEKLQLKHPEVAILTIKILEKYLSIYDSRVRFLRLSANERYERYCHEFPNIAHHVKMEYLATFLGISRSSISKLRSLKKV